MARILPLPRELEPKAAAAILRRLGLDWVEPEILTRPWPPIAPLTPGDVHDWWAGDEAMPSFTGAETDFPFEGRWSCDCGIRQPAQCRHVALVALAHAWSEPSLRRAFEVPGWALELEGLLQPPAPSADDGPHEGRVVYTLLPPDERDGPLPVRRELVRFSRRDGRPLRPLPAPESADELVTRIDGVTAADLAFHHARATLTLISLLDLPRGTTRSNAETRRAAVRRDAEARAFAALLSVTDLHDERSPLKPESRPYVPVLEAQDGDAGIELAWSTPLRAVYPFGPGYAITECGLFRPLALTHPLEDLSPLVEPLPTVPADEAGSFIEHFVWHSAVALSLDSVHLPPTRLADHLEARVRLAEEDDTLSVKLHFAYQLDGNETEVSENDRQAHLSVGPSLISRDRVRERRLAAQLAVHLGRPSPARLRGDSALDFLIDAPRALGQSFRFYGDRALLQHRVGGKMGVALRVPTGVDWFDLKVEFSLGDEKVRTADVLQSWLAGRRYHRLPSGMLARLPEEWLSKHGALSAELEALRDEDDAPLGLHALPLAVELLEEADGDTDRWLNIAERLKDVTGVPERDKPPGMKATLRDYQHEGYRWLCFLRDLGLGGCLADDMGLGKTVQVITLLLDTHCPQTDGAPAPRINPTLVVAPTSVVHNWSQEIGKFAPELRVLIHHGPDRGSELNRFAEYDVVLTSYALLRLDAELFTNCEWTYAVLDEAQQIKNPTSMVARTARALKTKHRLAVTGTPLENHLLELWSIFEFAMPGFFGSRSAFMRRYGNPIQRDQDHQAVRALHQRLRPFVLRRHKSEVAKELPPCQEQVLYCDLGPEQRLLYERVKSTYREAVLGQVARVGIGGATLSVLESLMRLRQACCDPGLLPYPEAQKVSESAKLELLEKLLISIVESGHRTLVFSQWPSLLRRVIRQIDMHGWNYLYLDGGTTKRHELVDVWNDPDGPPIFLISLKAGGSGLNLTGADHVIHLDPWWNPAVEDQARDRAHRIGQTRPVVSYKLVARDTVEEKILELQARKRALFEAAVESERLVVETLTRQDLESVFSPAMDGPVEPLRTPTPPKDDPNPLQNPDLPPALRTLIDQGAPLTNGNVRQAAGWDSEQARRWFRQQVTLGTLEKRGRKRGTHYVVVSR